MSAKWLLSQIKAPGYMACVGCSVGRKTSKVNSKGQTE